MKPATPKTEQPPSAQLRKAVFGGALRCVWAAVSLLSSGAVASASFYSFTKIADNSGEFSDFAARARLNESGVAVFMATYDAGEAGVFIGSGGPITPIMSDSGPLTLSYGLGTGAAPAINDMGVVAFLATYDDFSPSSVILFKGSGGPLTPVYDSATTPLSGSFGSGMAINNTDTVAFYNVLDGSPYNDGIFSGTGGTTYTTVAEHTNTTFNSPFNPYPSINNAGVVAFKASLDGGGSAVAKGSGGPATIIATTADPAFSAFFGNPDINEAGQVVFMAARDSGGSGIFVGDGTAAPIDFATTDDGFTGFTGDVAINDLGDVIFKANYGSFAIFNGRNPVLNSIVGSGTELQPGVFASGISLINGSLNDDRSFVFHALLSGSGQGIYRADLIAGNHPPVSVTISNRIVHAGSLVSLTATATDPDVPADILTFTLDPGAPATADINPTNGVFTWTPGSESIGSTNAITVRVTDNGAPALSATTTFQITVVSPPVFQSITLSGEDLTLTWSAIADSTYRVQYKVNLDDLTWTDLPGDVTATAASASKLDTIDGGAQRFYRIFLVL